MQPNVLIYLHGFNSSPDSLKAVQMREFIKSTYPEIELVMPQIALTPQSAWQQLTQLINQYNDCNIGLVGSSLGGFFSTLLSNQFGGKAVLINPAVAPYLIGDVILGQHTHPISGQRYSITNNELSVLKDLDWAALNHPENLWVLLQQGDEVLDYRRALEAYVGARITVEPHGNHSFIGFSRYLNAIVEFLFNK